MEHLVKPYTVIRLYSVHFDESFDLRKFALSHKNCKIHHKNTWRCTYTDNNFKLNIYKKGKYILFTKTLDEDDIRREMFKLFKKYPTKIFLRNWAIKFGFSKPLNLDSLKQDLKSSDLNKIFDIIFQVNTLKKKNVDVPKETVQLNKQAFTAIILRPFKGESNMAFSIFGSGKINVAGLKKKEDVEVVYKYFRESLIEKLLNNTADKPLVNDEAETDDLFSF